MNSSSRRYHCARCMCQVIICRRCDRGNVYCGKDCAKPARSQSKKRAAKRYQRSRRGRHTPPERQRRFRARKRRMIKKVTHQGSLYDAPNEVLPLAVKPRQDPQKTVSHPLNVSLHCHFCGCECTPFVRPGFRRQWTCRVNRKMTC